MAHDPAAQTHTSARSITARLPSQRDAQHAEDHGAAVQARRFEGCGDPLMLVRVAAAPGALRLPCGGWQLPQAYRSAAERRAVDDGAAVRGQRGLPVPGVAGSRGAAGQAA